MTRRVLVTRPQPGADRSGEKLTARGFAPLILPLTEIVQSHPSTLPDPAHVDVVVLTSVNAVRHAPAALLAALADKPVIAVGDATAAAAEAAGFTAVRSVSGDAVELARLAAAMLPAGSRLLHVTGVHRTFGLHDRLRQAGLAVALYETYRAQKVSYSTDFLGATLGGDTIWGAMVMSPRGAALLAELASHRVTAQLLERTLFFCISANVADTLGPFAAGRTIVSSEPSEAAVLQAMSSQA
ncbi:uroporphyrinogen-III synthase [Mesorhizobium sp. CAU 1741]|uniref:uroporphyrinogen-III synthase n=1 Tax=Mesorhizobium sp. CAU 1741 TaxID=3140366 RepID=UPI00325B05C5